MNKKRLIDFYNQPRNNGIFFSMSKNDAFKVLFENYLDFTEEDYHRMDFEYIYNKSGLKTLSCMLEQFIKGYIVDDDGDFVILKDGRRVTWDYVLNQVDQDIINFAIKVQYLNKWIELAKTLQLNFNPLQPYTWETNENTSDGLTSKNIFAGSNSKENDESYTSKRDTTNTDENTTNDDIYAFNSTDASPADLSKSNSSGTSTDNSENTGKSNSTENNNSSTDYTRDNTIIRNIMRKGNIGNKSSQQLIEEQRKMLEWQLFDVIFNDLDRVLTRSKYI